jgi:hypothetical protein
MGANAQFPSRQSARTTHRSNEHLGWAQVRHPFHPLRGQSFEVLKTRRVGGTETLILRHRERGTWAVAREWTDWAEPVAEALPGEAAARLDPWRTIELAELVGQLRAQRAGR